MERCRAPGIIDGLLAIGLAVCLTALIAVTVPLMDLASIVKVCRLERSARPVVSAPLMTAPFRPGDHGASVLVSPDAWNSFPPSPSSRLADRDDRGGQGDAQIYLREAAAVAWRYPWAGPWRGETRTDLWINDPASIGSSSRPTSYPVTPSRSRSDSLTGRTQDQEDY